MALGTNQGLSTDINVTPMIDVLLVLLVIFMLSVQLRRILPVNVPPPPTHSRSTGASRQIVLELKEDGSYAINGTVIAPSGLETRLHELTEGGARKLLFVHVGPKRRYGEVVQAVDLAKRAGWEIVAYMP